MPDETYDELLKFVRKQIWKAICYIDVNGKRHDIHYKEGVFGYPRVKDGKLIDGNKHKIGNAQSNDIKYCGFDLCPNRFAYITRPDVIEKVYGNDYVVFMSNKMGKLKHYQLMSYKVNN